MQRILKISEAAEYLRLKPSTLYTYVARRKIPFIKIGTRVLFDEADLVGFVDARRVPSITRPPKTGRREMLGVDSV